MPWASALKELALLISELNTSDKIPLCLYANTHPYAKLLGAEELSDTRWRGNIVKNSASVNILW